MSRVAEMLDLTSDLMRSDDERLADLAYLWATVEGARCHTREQMGALHDARKAAAGLLRHTLAEGATGRRAAVASTLAACDSDRAAIATSQRSALARGSADRLTEVEGWRARTRKAMRERQAARVAGRADLSAKLRQERDELAAETSSFLGHARARREAMATAQREVLTTGRAMLHTAVVTALDEFRGARAGLAQDLAESSQAWRRFAETMRTRRAGVQPGSPPATGETGAAPSSPSVQATANGVPADRAVFSYLADHPDGVHLVEIEEHFGVPFTRLAPILNRLVDGGRARLSEARNLFVAT